MSIPTLALAFLITAGPLFAQDLEALIEKSTLDELLNQRVTIVPATEQLDRLRELLWKKYQAEQGKQRKAEHDEHQLRFGGKTMRYAMHRVGDPPPGGYALFIGLHGGGGAPARVNDGQWKHMQAYYRNSVRSGIYVAPRGVANTWNLHFVGASYPLYDRLIENMILFEGVDPNQVYLAGFSAGGDGVYQVAARMPDRFAAVNMSAGHHNGVNPVNLCNLPMLLQVGERDGAYKRNRATVEYALKLSALRKNHPGSYRHRLFLHAGRPHNFPDNDPNEKAYPVIANPLQWLKDGNSPATNKNTNAVAWMGGHTRNPWPRELVWNPGTRADREGRESQFYWLDLGDQDLSKLETGTIRARLSRKANGIVIDRAGDELRILLHPRMLDLSMPITVQIEGKQLRAKAVPNLPTMIRSLVKRGDRNYFFDSSMTLKKTDGAWSLSSP